MEAWDTHPYVTNVLFYDRQNLTQLMVLSSL